jgi:hypothetical protein
MLGKIVIYQKNAAETLKTQQKHDIFASICIDLFDKNATRI